MRTVITCVTWFDGKDAEGYSYADRMRKYVDYYLPLKEELGFDEFMFVDNGSSYDTLSRFGCSRLDSETFHHRTFGHPSIKAVVLENLKRYGNYDYPYVWRFVYFVKKLFDHYDKVLIIDSDSFVLTKRLANFVRDTDTKWRSLWCPKYLMPECNLQVICNDAYNYYRNFADGDFMRYNGVDIMERLLPIQKIETRFVSDRYGDDGLVEQTPEMDFYSQCKLPIKMVFNADKT